MDGGCAPTARAISLPEATHARAILITRPEPDGSETAGRVAALGFVPILAPLQTIVSLPARLPPPTRVSALLFTSRHAIGPVPSAYHAIPVWAVGAATASRAESAGFMAVRAADGNAEALTRAVTDAFDPGRDRLLLVTGQGHGRATVQRLRAAGFRVARRVTYATRAAGALPEPARAALLGADPVAVMLYSAGAARVFLGLAKRAYVTPHLARHDAIVISQAVAREMMDPRRPEGYGRGESAPGAVAWRRVLIAASPDQDAMLALTR